MVPRLKDFEGCWRISRVITDNLGPEATFEGEAVFAASDDGLAYRETGFLRLGEAEVFQAERSYRWREVAGRIVVAFPDGKPFHDFDPAAPEAQHLCVADAYRVRYDFTGWPDWRADWSVRGPRKDYAMVSRYRRP